MTLPTHWKNEHAELCPVTARGTRASLTLALASAREAAEASPDLRGRIRALLTQLEEA